MQVALDGRGACRRFKNAPLDFPAERERWFAFRRERLHRRRMSGSASWASSHDGTTRVTVEPSSLARGSTRQSRCHSRATRTQLPAPPRIVVDAVARRNSCQAHHLQA